ncbi:carbohydrate porin [Klebsiella pneumoniae]|uniref:carbohydrate porin n=1 Tax=Klebsiella pneumoniae TaxID=573 RepID=UPI003D6A99B7
MEYLLAFHDYDNGKDNTDNRKNYGAIVRPMYFWNEAGYQRVDYDQGGDNHGWKLTLSQNIAIGMGPEFRPMLRFYVTGGQVDNEHTAKVRCDSVVEGAFPAGATLSRATTEEACGIPPPGPRKRSAAGRSGTVPAVVPDGGIHALSGLRS